MLSRLCLTVFRMSLYGAAAAVLVWLVCQVLRRIGTPRSICCALWLAVLVCLVCPVGIPVPVKETPPAAAVNVAIDKAALHFTQPPVIPAMGEAHSPAQSRQTLPAAVWLVGVLVLAVYSIWADCRLRRKVALAYRVDDPDGCYYTGSCVDTPFIAGLLRPHIYLPAGLSAAQKQTILLHERAHLHRQDHWVKLLFYAALCLHWFNPLVWLAYRQMVLDMESACDEAVLRRLGDAVKPAYCRSLLHFALHGGPAAPLAFGESNVKARIRRILDYRRPCTWAVAGSAVLACIIAVVCLVRPVQAASDAGSAASVFATGGAGSAVSLPGSGAAQNEAGTLPPDSEAAAWTGDSAAQEPGSVAVSSDALLWPVPDYTSVSHWMDDSHKGVDICAGEGTEILAAAPGVVVAAGYDAAGAGYGYSVILSHGDGVYTVYGHCSALYAEAGQSVAEGQRIAAVGSTGRSTGNHLHFGIFQTDELHLPEPAGSNADTESEASASEYTYMDPQDLFPGK